MDGAPNAAMFSDFKDDLAREAGVVTPGVDDTPYIQYAIESLTRDRDTEYSANPSSGFSDTPVNLFPGDGASGYYHLRGAEHEGRYQLQSPVAFASPLHPVPAQPPAVASGS